MRKSERQRHEKTEKGRKKETAIHKITVRESVHKCVQEVSWRYIR